MRSTRKILLMLIAIAALVSATVFATVAYFTDEASVTNTFTIGKVQITLDETQVDTDGVPVTPAARDAGQLIGAISYPVAIESNCSASNVSVTANTIGCTDDSAGKNIRNDRLYGRNTVDASDNVIPTT